MTFGWAVSPGGGFAAGSGGSGSELTTSMEDERADPRRYPRDDPRSSPYKRERGSGARSAADRPRSAPPLELPTKRHGAAHAARRQHELDAADVRQLRARRLREAQHHA